MTTTYDDAVVTLYQAPLEGFVAERKRLSEELKTGGDKAGAARLAKLGRPTVSAWVVNQLWWQEREALTDLFAIAQKLREGELDAAGEHREAIAKLRARAATILDEAGHATPDSTLRRVATTLSALAVTAGFDPDPPGALSGDRDPPGFEAVEGLVLAPSAEPRRPAAGAPAKPKEAKKKAEEAGERAALEEHRRAEERAQKEAERAKKHERERLEASLKAAKSDVEARTSDLERLRAKVVAVEEKLEEARRAVEDCEKRLVELDEGD